MAYERFIDKPENREIIKNAFDFSLRRHGIPPFWVVYLCIAVLLINIILISELCIGILVSSANDPIPTGKIIFTLVTVSVLTTGAAIFSYVMISRIRDVLMRTEFQNLLFSSSMSANTVFAIITNTNKQLLHYDQHFDHLFVRDKEDTATFAMLEEHEAMDEHNRQKLHESIVTNTSQEIPLTLNAGTKDEKKLLLKVEPLKRPEDFCVIRAYNV